ncbi:MAG TPA: hypothetical protein VFT13_14110 [Candidatus Krumholzibacteria bacterium]|nr:hypothetical protein [Candidatus Krumholzibacteria bacterium]
MMLPLAAPYLAVGVFWFLFHDAWLAILAYHAQILWWARGTRPALVKPGRTPAALLILPFVLAGPALAVLLPHIARIDLATWLERYHLTGPGLIVLTFYFGLVHPVLEQIHWAPLRERTPFAHAAFAGYHLLVLGSLLSVPWLAVCFVVLWLASWLWQRMTRASRSLWPAVAAQAVADLGVILVATLGV